MKDHEHMQLDSERPKQAQLFQVVPESLAALASASSQLSFPEPSPSGSSSLVSHQAGELQPCGDCTHG